MKKIDEFITETLNEEFVGKVKQIKIEKAALMDEYWKYTFILNDGKEVIAYEK